jgi:hypothetical protein
MTVYVIRHRRLKPLNPPPQFRYLGADGTQFLNRICGWRALRRDACVPALPGL